jgi:hypothetical protein
MDGSSLSSTGKNGKPTFYEWFWWEADGAIPVETGLGKLQTRDALLSRHGTSITHAIRDAFLLILIAHRHVLLFHLLTHDNHA